MTDLAFRLVWLREQGCILSGKQHLAYICENRGILHRSNKKDKSSFSGPTFLFEINHPTDCTECSDMGTEKYFLLKFRLSEKERKFEKNLPLKIWHYWVSSNFRWNIFSNFLSFSESLNFIDTMSFGIAICLDRLLDNYHLGTFTNYVDNFLAFDHLPTP